MEFNVKELETALENASIKIKEVRESKSDSDATLIIFKNSKLRYIKVPKEYDGLHNCINIYHGKSTKNGFWWNHKISYKQLVNELLKYHS